MSSPWKAVANSQTGTGEYAVAPSGSHVAVLVGMVDLGTHSKEFKNDDGTVSAKDYRSVFLVWELTDEADPSHRGHNFLLSKEFTLALGTKAALRPVVEVWLGRKLGDGEEVPDLSKMLGSKCMLTVEHGQSKSSGKTYANVKGVGPVHKSLAVPPAKREPFLYAIEDGDFEPPAWLPQWSYGEKIADKMTRSKEYRRASVASARLPGDEDDVDAPGPDDAPF